MEKTAGSISLHTEMNEPHVVGVEIFGIYGPAGMAVIDMPANWLAIQFFDNYRVRTNDGHPVFWEDNCTNGLAFTWSQPEPNYTRTAYAQII